MSSQPAARTRKQLLETAMDREHSTWFALDTVECQRSRWDWPFLAGLPRLLAEEVADVAASS